MPFKERSIVSDREEFCRLALVPGANVRALCRGWPVSVATGYKWLARYKAEGLAGLADRSRRPLRSPERTADAVEGLVLAVRRDHPVWGGRKIRRVLQDDGFAAPPAASTITAILRRHDLLDGPRAGEARDFQRFERAAPNELWQMDFKGHFAIGEGRCHPLTVLDDHSRYALAIAACGDEQDLTVRARLTQVFRRYGRPNCMLADNGSPWGSSGRELTKLAVWLIDLEIALIHGRPFHPQTQGKDERFHRTLKAEVLDGRFFPTLAQAQAAFHAWREVYNLRRPHEALDMATPATRYVPSPRTMPQDIEPPLYEAGAHVRTVGAAAAISFKNRKIKCPKALVGRRVALRATATDGVFDLCYRSHTMAQIDLRQNIIQPVRYVPEHPSTLSPV